MEGAVMKGGEKMENKSTLEILMRSLPSHYDLSQGSVMKDICEAVAKVIDIKINSVVKEFQKK